MSATVEHETVEHDGIKTSLGASTAWAPTSHTPMAGLAETTPTVREAPTLLSLDDINVGNFEPCATCAPIGEPNIPVMSLRHLFHNTESEAGPFRIG